MNPKFQELPAQVKELTARSWDALIIGAGHNGLTCAAYLALAGKKVLILERRTQIGGACTLEETWPGYRISPCAYLCGLLHPLIIKELQMAKNGFRWVPAESGLFVPFEDGSSIQLWEDDAACEAEVRRFAPADVNGWRAMCDLLRRTRDRLRPPDENDFWIGRAPTRDQIMERLEGDKDAAGLLFEWSMSEFAERYLKNELLQIAVLGQGVIGTNASPFDKGTASINFHHSSGRMNGMAGVWGYVEGGMGRISFILSDIAKKAGAVVAAGVPVARILPGEGVLLEGGERLHAPVVISNADPCATLKLLDEAADPEWRRRVEAIPMIGCTVKLSVALRELPNFKARPGIDEPHHRGQVNTPLSKSEWVSAFEAARSGELPPRLWTELYFQTALDPSIAPEGRHAMSVFAQYVPYAFSHGDWESRREEVTRTALESIGRFCTNLPQAVEAVETLGPPDIEEKLGLTGGHIFHGEILPEYMWENRLQSRTPMKGVFLCGAGTHPGGSVIAVNGRNAAMEVLSED